MKMPVSLVCPYCQDGRLVVVEIQIQVNPSRAITRVEWKCPLGVISGCQQASSKLCATLNACQLQTEVLITNLVCTLDLPEILLQRSIV